MNILFNLLTNRGLMQHNKCAQKPAFIVLLMLITLTYDESRVFFIMPITTLHQTNPVFVIWCQFLSMVTK